MALLKSDKKKLAQQYVKHLEEAECAVVLRHQDIPVNEINQVRIEIEQAQGKLEAVKKRVFLKGIDKNYEGPSLETMEGSVAVLYSYNADDLYGPLKVIHRFRNKRKKEKVEYLLDYVGGWYDKSWKDKGYVSDLASLPSKEELVAKFLFLLNHPVSSFARAVKAIADKKEANS